MAEHHPLRSDDQNPTTATYAALNTDAERRAKQCKTAQMPNLSHLHMRDYHTVYEPSDDTYLLIDAIGADVDAMMEGRDGDNGGSDGDGDGDEGSTRKRSDVKITLEIGCGTGTPSVYLAMRLRGLVGGIDNESEAIHENTKNAGPIHHVTDINADAIRIAKATAENNGIPSTEFRAHQCDLASDLLPSLQQTVDVLIFNPPYVPTPDDEVGSNGIEASWAGGTDGRVVLDRALPQIAKLLAYPHGMAYIVAVDDNYPERIAAIMERDYGVKVVPWFRRRARNEFLTILKMTPTREFVESEGRP